MFKIPVSGILLGASKVSTKMFVPSISFHVSAPMKLKESKYNCVMDNAPSVSVYLMCCSC